MSEKAALNVPGLLSEFSLHRGGAAESLIEKMINTGTGADTWRLDLTQEERRILGHTLASGPSQPTSEEVLSALACLARRRLSRRLETINRELAAAEERGDAETVGDLMLLKGAARMAAEALEEF